MAKENSGTSNSLCQVVSSTKRSGGDQSTEESGWTMYFEDFLNSNHSDEPTCFSSDIAPDQTYSVADAASSIADHKPPGDHNEAAAAAAVAVASGLSCKDIKIMNSFKKRKMKELFVQDDSLEDTASSPVNSPKVSDSTYFSRNQKHRENFVVAPQVEERNEMGFVEMHRDFTELKKRGLCLVPLSMVVDYLAE